jgi:hypothetical protein
MDSTLMLHGESAIAPVYAGATPGGA